MARRRVDVFSLSFLDAMTCGFGAVVLFYMVINASVSMRADRTNQDLSAEVDRLQQEVVDGYRDLVELRNAIEQVDDETTVARGLARRLIESVEAITVELATFEDTTLARKEALEKLKADLRSLEEDSKRLSASLPSDETPGDRVRAFVGDGDRQYLTGLKVGGDRIAILVDVSASMLAETVVNVIRRRNLPDATKVRSEKWQRVLATVDWVVAQLPRDGQFQLYTFAEQAGAVLPETAGSWLASSDREQLDRVVEALRDTVPDGGTALVRGLSALQELEPRPDNVILLVDGLPTLGEGRSRRTTVTARQRLRLFDQAIERAPRRVPINVILFPMEGDPRASGAYWKWAVDSRGSFLSPPRDWP